MRPIECAHNCNTSSSIGRKTNTGAAKESVCVYVCPCILVRISITIHTKQHARQIHMLLNILLLYRIYEFNIIQIH